MQEQESKAFEEILGLQWDCVFLDVPTPYISVRLSLIHISPVQVTPYMLNPPVEATGSDYAEEVEPEEDDTDFEAWGFREKEESVSYTHLDVYKRQ